VDGLMIEQCVQWSSFDFLNKYWWYLEGPVVGIARVHVERPTCTHLPTDRYLAGLVACPANCSDSLKGVAKLLGPSMCENKIYSSNVVSVRGSNVRRVTCVSNLNSLVNARGKKFMQWHFKQWECCAESNHYGEMILLSSYFFFRKKTQWLTAKLKYSKRKHTCWVGIWVIIFPVGYSRPVQCWRTVCWTRGYGDVNCDIRGFPP
jgi:hypothetical protein